MAPDGTVVYGAPTTGEAALACAIARANPRPGLGGWRLFANRYRTRTLRLGEDEIAVRYRENRGVIELAPGDGADAGGGDDAESGHAVSDIRVLGVQGDPLSGCVTVRLQVDGVDRFCPVRFHGAAIEVGTDAGTLVYTQVPVFAEPAEELAPGSLVAPMPGTVIRVAAEVGASVERGAPLVWIEAMKMEHKVVADAAGVLSDLRVAAGDQVQAGALLAVVDTGDDVGKGE